ncbi:MAG: class I SAM-dependent methyltransferase [Candidatus Natronoplasma sp.]
MFDKIATVYDHISWLFLPNVKRDILDHIQLKENDKVLDVGGGTGKLIDTVLRENPNVKGYVLDRSRSMLRKAPSKEEVILGDSAMLPFCSNCFDFVFCVDALHHFEDKNKSLAEMIRVSKMDGEIIILELDPNNYMTKFVEFGERILGEPSKFYEDKCLKRVFLKKGFRVRIEKINFFQYLLQAKR